MNEARDRGGASADGPREPSRTTATAAASVSPPSAPAAGCPPAEAARGTGAEWDRFAQVKGCGHTSALASSKGVAAREISTCRARECARDDG